jgi:hypothetical protein
MQRDLEGNQEWRVQSKGSGGAGGAWNPWGEGCLAWSDGAIGGSMWPVCWLMSGGAILKAAAQGPRGLGRRLKGLERSCGCSRCSGDRF